MGQTHYYYPSSRLKEGADQSAVCLQNFDLKWQTVHTCYGHLTIKDGIVQMLATITNSCIAVIELGSTSVRQTSSIWVEESLDLIEMDASDKSHSKFSLLQFHIQQPQLVKVLFDDKQNCKQTAE